MTKIAESKANSVDLDQTAPLEQSDLGLHCFAYAFLSETYSLHTIYF